MTTYLDAAIVRAELMFETLTAGMESAAYVRGGMDPAYATPAARDAEARQIAVYAPNLAAAFLAGWAAHRPRAVDEPTSTVWHRLIGRTCIEVVCS